jgi:hypothetical protein
MISQKFKDCWFDFRNWHQDNMRKMSEWHQDNMYHLTQWHERNVENMKQCFSRLNPKTSQHQSEPQTEHEAAVQE